MIGDLEIHLVHNTKGKIECGGKKIHKGCSLPGALFLRLEKENGSEETLAFGGYTGGERRGL